MDTRTLDDLVRATLHGPVTRRAFLMKAAAVGLSATAAGGLLAACGEEDDGGDGGATGEAVSLSLVTWGGSWGDAVKQAWVEPFMAANTNITVVMDEPTEYPKIKAMVEANSVDWDVVNISNDFGIGPSFEKYCEPLDKTIVPFDELQPELFPTTGYRVPVISYSVVVGYRSDKLGGKAPTSFADFFDLQNFPGKRGVYDYVSGGLPEMALVADGVPPDALYPLDMDRAYKKIDTIKDALVWWDTGAQSVQLLADGEVGMGMSWNGRLTEANEQGSDIGIMWDQHILTADYLMITKGSKKTEAANQLIAWMISADNNAEITKYIDYGPANIDAIPKVDPAVADKLPTAYLDTAFGFDDMWWAENYDKVVADWQSYIQG